MDQSLNTYAGTATRWGQRVVNSAAAQEMPDWLLFSFGVSAAFAKGLSSEELSKLIGEPLRVVHVELSEKDVAVLRTISGYESFVTRRKRFYLRYRRSMA